MCSNSSSDANLMAAQFIAYFYDVCFIGVTTDLMPDEDLIQEDSAIIQVGRGYWNLGCCSRGTMFFPSL